MANKARLNPEEVSNFAGNLNAVNSILQEVMNDIKTSGKVLSEQMEGNAIDPMNETLVDTSKLIQPIEERITVLKGDVNKLFENEQAAIDIINKTKEEMKQRMADLKKKLAG